MPKNPPSWAKFTLVIVIVAWVDTLFFQGLLGLRHGVIFLIAQTGLLPALNAVWGLGAVYWGLPWISTPLSVAAALCLSALGPQLKSLWALWVGFCVYILGIGGGLTLIYPEACYSLMQADAIVLGLVFPGLLRAWEWLLKEI